MRRSVIFMIAFCLVLLMSPRIFAQGEGGLRVENFQSQIVSGPDSSGYVEFTVTATAWNFSDYGQQFSIPVRGLDSKGATLVRVTLEGRIGSREEGTLKGAGSMRLQGYESIVNWEQEQ